MKTRILCIVLTGILVFSVTSCSTQKCTNFIDYQTNTVNIKNIGVQLGKMNVGVGEISSTSQYREASEHIQQLNMVQVSLCNQIKNTPDKALKEQYRKEYVETLLQMLNPNRQITIETSPKNITAPKDSPFFVKGHDSYMGLGANLGYPWTLGLGFLGRHNIIAKVGIGYYLSFGMDFGGSRENPTSPYVSNDYIAPIHYQIGLKLFPYQHVFVSAGYGTLGCEKVKLYNDSDGRFAIEGIRQRKGIPVSAGYDYVFGNLHKDVGGVLSISGGMSYDTFTAEWKPLINIKVSLAWGL